jgi:hypothetical protein
MGMENSVVFPTEEHILAGFSPIEVDAQLCVDELRINPLDLEAFTATTTRFEMADAPEHAVRGIAGFYCGCTVYLDASIPRGKVRLSTDPLDLFLDSPSPLTEPVVVWV